MAVGLLASLTLFAGSSADNPAKAGDVSEARVLSEASEGANWMVDGGDFGEKHFSPLKEITDKNIHDLGLAWWLDIDSPMGMTAEPIVVDGRIYVTDSLSRVYARGRLVGAAAVEVRSENSARHEHAEFLFRPSQSRRGGLEWQGVRRHGRLPSVCDRRGLRTTVMGLAHL